MVGVARTSADLAGVDTVGPDAVHEAATFRALDTEPSFDIRDLLGVPAAPARAV
jgi:hypothetical protein